MGRAPALGRAGFEAVDEELRRPLDRAAIALGDAVLVAVLRADEPALILRGAQGGGGRIDRRAARKEWVREAAAIRPERNERAQARRDTGEISWSQHGLALR